MSTDMRARATPDWAITIIWFIAGIFATGSFWYFLSSGNPAGTVISACATCVLAVLAIALHARNDRLRQRSQRSGIPARLLSFVWTYPLSGENEASWAVKESAVLIGKLGSAREQPALGVAIVTTELALASFGSAADSRIERCISWGVARAEREPPHRFLVEVRDPSDYEVERLKPDFRHTLAFGVILARARKHYSYLKSHLELVLARQEGDGGWPPESAAATSPVFTAFYAVELLHLALSDPAIPERIRTAIPAARANGLRWLMEHRGPDGLWSSGVLRAFAWDGVFATAWVLHRLACTAEVPVAGWRHCLQEAMFVMIQHALEPQTWAGSTEAQRYRVEARVAAAVCRARRMSQLSARSREAARLYQGSWSARAANWVNQLPPEEMDVSTAAFLVWGLVSEEHLPDLGRAVLSSERIEEDGPPIHQLS
jgi:hypothetical protein